MGEGEIDAVKRTKDVRNESGMAKHQAHQVFSSVLSTGQPHRRPRLGKLTTPQVHSHVYLDVYQHTMTCFYAIEGGLGDYDSGLAFLVTSNQVSYGLT